MPARAPRSLEQACLRPMVLRVKRPRACAAVSVLAVEDGAAGCAKRARLSVPVGALDALSLAGRPHAPSQEPTPDEDAGTHHARRAGFRRLDPESDAICAVIKKARVVDVTERLLKRRAVAEESERGAGFTCNGLEMVREDLCSLQCPKDDTSVEKVVHVDQAKESTGTRDEDCCGGDSEAVDKMQEETDFVYDVYVRDDDAVSSSVSADAVLLASDIPEVDLWSGGDSSEEDIPDDLDDSEGSVDYPSTPEEDAYVREVVPSEDESNSSDDFDGYIDRRAGLDEHWIGSSAFGIRHLERHQSTGLFEIHPEDDPASGIEDDPYEEERFFQEDDA